MSKRMKALPVYIYREAGDASDYSNGGISSRFNQILLLCDEGYVDIDEENGLPENLCHVVEVGRGHKAIEPFVTVDEGNVGWMYGGCICDTSDSRFNRLSGGYPLHLHDRQETAEEYRILSM